MFVILCIFITGRHILGGRYVQFLQKCGNSFRDALIAENGTRSCGSFDTCSQLNVAVGGATNVQMLSQAERLVDRMKDNFTLLPIDYENDWKMISLFIGGNDLCRVCRNEVCYVNKSDLICNLSIS